MTWNGNSQFSWVVITACTVGVVIGLSVMKGR